MGFCKRKGVECDVFGAFSLAQCLSTGCFKDLPDAPIEKNTEDGLRNTTMINIEELNDIISQMSEYKPIKAIKVTTRFFDYLELMTKLSPYYSAPPVKPHAGDPATLRGVPVIIDDEIDGFYKVEF